MTFGPGDDLNDSPVLYQGSDTHSDNSSPESIPDHSPKRIKDSPEVIEFKKKSNYFTRWAELGKTGFASELASVVVARDYAEEMHEGHPSVISANNETQIAVLSGNFLTVLLAWGFHRLFTRYGWYQYDKGSENPFYRVLKTFLCIAIIAATLSVNLLPVSPATKILLYPIATAIFCLGASMFALAYRFIREKIKQRKKAQGITEDTTYCSVGPDENWSKSVKSFLVWGTALGQIAGWLFCPLTHATLSSSIAIGSGFGGIILCLVGALLIPLINWIGKKCGKVNPVLRIDKKKDDEKELFRNNYVRAGITFGQFFGMVGGFLLGILLFHGIAPLVSAIVGGAIGSVLCGVMYGFFGHKISHYTRDHWGVGKDTRLIYDGSSENTWDYSVRATSFMMGSAGSLVGTLCDEKNMNGITIGNAIGGALGWLLGFPVIYLARKIKFTEEPDSHLPWTQRLSTGVNIGTMIGGFVGLLFFVTGCMTGGALGLLAVGVLFGAIGGIIGGIVGTFCYGNTGTMMLKEGFKKLKDAKQNSATAAVPSPSQRISPDEVKARSNGAIDPADPALSVRESRIAQWTRNASEKASVAKLTVINGVTRSLESIAKTAVTAGETGRMFPRHGRFC